MPSPLDQAAAFIANLSPKRGVNVVANSPQTVANRVANTPLVANKTVANTESLVANRHGQYADKDKRREYMRDYMAKRRGNHVS